MNTLAQIMDEYLNAPEPDANAFVLGENVSSLSINKRLKILRDRNRKVVWICIAMIIIFFIVVLTTTIVKFDALLAYDGAIQAVFGISSGTLILLMMRYQRETLRSELMLILIGELADKNPSAFRELSLKFYHKWFTQRLS